MAAVVSSPSNRGVVVPSAQLSPAVVAERGPQGAPGIAGPVGPQGATGPAGQTGPQGRDGATFAGFGSVDYADLDAGTPLPLPAGTWTRVLRDAAPSAANFAPLAAPFAGFTFWDGAMLRARALGDVYLVKFLFTATPYQRGSGLRFAVRPADDPAFDFGPEPIVLSVDAGVPQTGSETFMAQVRTRFAGSGATLYVMSTTGAILTQFSPEVTPLSHP